MDTFDRIFMPLKFFLVFFVTLFGLAQLVRGEPLIGAFLTAIGLTFFTMVFITTNSSPDPPDKTSSDSSGPS